MKFRLLFFLRLFVLMFLLVFFTQGFSSSVFSQDDDSLSELLRKIQDDSAAEDAEEDEDTEKSGAPPIISPGAPAIHSGKVVTPVDDEDEEEDEEDDEEEVEVADNDERELEDSLIDSVHKEEDDEGEVMLDATIPRSLTGGGLQPLRQQQSQQATPGPTTVNPNQQIKPSVPPGTYVPVDDASVGCPFAPQMLKVLQDEMINGLNGRNVMGRFNTWRGYMSSTLNSTRTSKTGTEVNGLARLSWYEELYRDPVMAVFKADQFSRYIHAGLSSGNSMHLAETMGEIRKKLDVPKREDDGLKFVRVDTPEQAIQEVIRCITLAQSHYARAVSKLTPAELNLLNSQLYNALCANETHGHQFNNGGAAVQMLTLLLKVDRGAIHDAAEALLPLSDDRLLACLKQLNPNRFQSVMLEGQSMNQIMTPAGTILIGGHENNTYNLDGFREADEIVCIIDLGGHDTYREGTCNLNRPVFVIIDLDGDDQYIATKPGVQGGSLLGISMLIDCAGNDRYTAKDVAQGSSIGGAGILIDKGGNDTYYALRRAQGAAFGGIGMLIDQGGNDRYHAAMWSQGFGHSAGFGVLEDVDGRDYYYLGGLYEDSYPEHPGYEGWGQGLGSGFRGATGSACGGIGMLLDGGGDDVYEFDYIAHGGGYWLGVGMLRDFGGNDQHIGATKKDYQGNPRPESGGSRPGVQPRWQRFCSGFGCHYALGFLFDDAGDDYYEGTIMGMGMGWDLSVGYLCDFDGNDKFVSRGGLMQGVGAQGSLGVLLNYFGNDTYQGGSQGYASPTVDPKYHNTAQCGGNFGFLVDYGGKDTYSTGVKNNSYNTRGSGSGFLIDRPLETEPQDPPPTPPVQQQRPQPQPQQRPPVQPQVRPQPQPQRPPAQPQVRPQPQPQRPPAQPQVRPQPQPQRPPTQPQVRPQPQPQRPPAQLQRR